MKTLSRARNLAVAILAMGAIAAPAVAAEGRPDGTLHLSGGSVAFFAGASWGHGRLQYRGHSYRVKVKGLKVGSIGAASFRADGHVYHLRHLRDINGAFGEATASATAGSGRGVVTLQNDKGVIVDLATTSSGLQLTLAPGGLDIELE